jgi:diadenosine tetraphosphatase ApaH/serine/threonine PP2A family protein phosphatase
MFAVLSDIHGNLEALDAVLADIARRPVSAVCCLGDIVGYGPNPVECLERAMTWGVVLSGNFDSACLADNTAHWSAVSAAKSLAWSRNLVTGLPHFNFLAQRPPTYCETEFLFVHGSARNPLHEYVFPEDIYNQPKMTQIASFVERYCFAGHTHVPGVFVEPDATDALWECFAPAEINHFWRFDGRKTIVNVGSVGQPRDGDPRACYVTVDGWDVTFHRIAYDVETTVAKIYEIPELDNFLGDRLREGR